MAGPAELEIVDVGEGEGDGAEAVAVATLGIAVAVGVGLGWLELPSIVPMTRPTIAAGTKSATRTDRRPILVGVRC